MTKHPEKETDGIIIVMQYYFSFFLLFLAGLYKFAEDWAGIVFWILAWVVMWLYYAYGASKTEALGYRWASGFAAIVVVLLPLDLLLALHGLNYLPLNDPLNIVNRYYLLSLVHTYFSMMFIQRFTKGKKESAGQKGAAQSESADGGSGNGQDSKVTVKVVSSLVLMLAAVVITVVLLVRFNEVTYGLQIEKDDIAALDQMGKDGNAEACYCLHLYYAKTDEGGSWFNRAVMNGHSQAQYVGYAALKDDPNTAKRAMELLKLSAKQSNAFAQAGLGREYQAGKLVPKDLGQAEQWYRKAIESGATYVMQDLAALLAESRSDVKGLAEAYQWVLLAASGIRPDQKSFMESIEKQKAAILKKASDAGIDENEIINRGESGAAARGKTLVEKDLIPDWNKRCKDLGASGKGK